MVSPLFPGRPIPPPAALREDPLPSPLVRCGRVLPGERIRQGDPAESVREVALVNLSSLSEVDPERFDQRNREHGRSILRSLPFADEDGAPIEVDVLNPKA